MEDIIYDEWDVELRNEVWASKKQLMGHLNNKKPSIVRSIRIGWSEKGFGERLLAANEDKVMTYLNKNFNFLQHSLANLLRNGACACQTGSRAIPIEVFVGRNFA